jgi:transposase
MIGVDPHKGSHTAVAIDKAEFELARLKVRATRRQAEEFLGWASQFEERTWAVESAGVLGYLLSEQLLAAGEAVVDVPATLAARVRLLGSGRSQKNDPNDARSSPACSSATPATSTSSAAKATTPPTTAPPPSTSPPAAGWCSDSPDAAPEA